MRAMGAEPMLWLLLAGTVQIWAMAALVGGPAVADQQASGWQKSAFALLDHNRDGSISLSEAAEGYLTAGQPGQLWRAASAASKDQIRDKWVLSCRRSAWSSTHGEKDPAGLVDCASFGSRLRLLAGEHEAAVLGLEEVLAWWARPAHTTDATLSIAGLGILTPTSAASVTPPPPPAWILVSSDWHLEPWFAGDAFNVSQPWMHGGVVRFMNASLTNMMTCADGATGLRPLPCNLAGNKDPPIGHAVSHFEAFQRLHPPPATLPETVAAPSNSFFFIGDTQAHLMNFTNHDGDPGSAERKKYNPLPGGLEWNTFSPSYRMAPAVGALMTKILSLVNSHFASEHVYWGAGNHDGPEDKVFCSNDSSVQEVSLAWARPLVAAGIVDNKLNRTYAGDATTTTAAAATEEKPDTGLDQVSSGRSNACPPRSNSVSCAQQPSLLW